MDSREPRSPETSPASRSREVPVTRPIADREVPIAGHVTPATVHAWLDGELAESAVHRGETSHDVEFWLRVDRELEVRRHLVTPAHVLPQIMEALPTTAPRAETWWRRELTINPMVALAAMTAALALGIMIGTAVLRAR